MKFTRLASAVILCTASLPIFAASYSITELPTVTQGQNQYGASIDNTGLILTAIENRYNAPIDISLLNFESAELQAALTDIESAKNGVFNLADYTYLVNRMITGSRNFSLFTQQLGAIVTYRTDGTDFSFVPAFDTQSEALNGFSYSMETVPKDSVAGTHIVGNTEGPFRTVEYTNAEGTDVKYVVSDFDRRAFVQVGDTATPLLATDLTLGGTSVVNAINANFVAVGSGSIAPTTALTAGLENCADDDVRADQPIEACHRRIITVTSGSSTGRRSGLWLQRAHLWTVDSEGAVTDTTVYGTLVADEEPASSGSSQALDINNNGVAVGVASVKVNEGSSLSTAAAIFKDGAVTRIIADDELLPNSAITLNDKYVVGLQSKSINRALRSKMFVYNMGTDEVVFQNGFFTSSSTIPRAINSSNLVVGAGDVEASASSAARKTAAFLYDIEADTFSNLNTLIPCDSKFDLIEALDINDSGEIIASALTKTESRDARGNLFKDESGNNVMVDTVVTVKLTPTGTSADACSNAERGVAERQGASSGILLFAMLFLSMLFRRTIK